MSGETSERLEFELLAEEHLGPIMEIEVEAYPEPWTEGMFQEEMRGPHSHFFVAFLDGAIVGYGGFWMVADEAHLTSVTVRDTYRGRGLGRTLLTYLLDVAKGLGVRKATLEVRESNVRARNLYASMGFAEAGLRKGYYSKTNENAVLMVKRLQP